jgi:predicted amidophosphoribosyltransferase
MITTAGALGWGFQPACRLCRCRLAGVGPLCPACRLELPWRAWAAAPAEHELLTGAGLMLRAAFAYRYPLDRLIAAVKGGGDAAVLDWLSGAAVEALSQTTADEFSGACFCPVPTRPGRLRRRRSDLPQRLAEQLAARFRGRSYASARWREGRDVAQHGADSGTRRKRASGRFVMADSLRGQPLILVDDVCTTGATLAALAEAAGAAGARVQGALVLALTDPPGEGPAQTSRFTTDRA